MNQSNQKNHPDRLTCPSCGKVSGVPLVWGEPDRETWEAFLREELVLAGCVIEPNGGAVPDYACLHCSHRWILQ
ncbi:MAG TPA: hypothetical protein VGE12_07400 [Noviherbaspirillum sp.]